MERKISSIIPQTKPVDADKICETRTENFKYEYWMASLYKISDNRRRQACHLAGDAEQMYTLSPDQLKSLHFFSDEEIRYIVESRRAFDAEREWSLFQERGIRFLPYAHADYPEKLRPIYDPPFAVYVKGCLPDESVKSIAVVGARACSEYGRSVARMLGRVLAEHGAQVISGMAAGIDSASHAGALSVNGHTFAVLGSGCDICYPKSSSNIYHNIQAGGGGIISELAPGTHPLPQFFPRRNRIISALSDAVVVVEAKTRSGSLITADQALEQGKDVYAVPGRFTDTLSAGCNHLIEQGAGILADLDNFLKNTGVVSERKIKDSNVKINMDLPLEKEEYLLYSNLDFNPKFINSIIEETGLDILTVLSALDSLKKSIWCRKRFKTIIVKKCKGAAVIRKPAGFAVGPRCERGFSMAKNLVIVESPAKVKTIKKFLGKNYEVAASNGHVRDLPKSTLGIDVDHDFEPKYITIRGKGDILATLRKEAKKADKVFLATDPDREGEAISWHLSQALKLDDKNVRRITFNEITKSAVKESLKHPRDINMNLVDAQQTRRILDRLVGYKISPLLWAKVKRGLSAGRVQSVALRIICDREEEINAFIPEEYWTLSAVLQAEGERKPLTAEFYGDEDGRITIHNEQELQSILRDLDDAEFQILDVKTSDRTKKPPLPFRTSTLQQEASRHLNFSTQKTMRIAQQLYEGVDIKGSGTVGLITYLRTDSTRVSDEAQRLADAYIADYYGERYLGGRSLSENVSAHAQDAHEAIRPTDISRSPVMLKESLSRDQFRLYQIIWNRFVASRMSQACYETTAVLIGAGAYRFRLTASQLKFDGFLSVYTLDEKKPDTVALSGNLDTGTVLTRKKLEEKQHFTQPPAHFTEASLVKALEDLGIGRPSTYAPTITTLLGRRYVIKENKNIYVSELGEVVNRIMKDEFPSIVDEQFTANMESLLDNVEEGTVDWKVVVRNFYPDLDMAVKAAEQNLEKVEIADEVSDEICELCGRNMVIKYGPHGRFLACPGFPDCRNTRPLLEKIGVPCPKCGKELVLRKTKKGRRYYGCENHPDCDFMSWQKPSAMPCPECGSYMVEKGNKLVCAGENCGYVCVKQKKERKQSGEDINE